MTKKPNTGMQHRDEQECVEARDLIIAKRPRRRSAHLNDTEARPLEEECDVSLFHELAGLARTKIA